MFAEYLKDHVLAILLWILASIVSATFMAGLSIPTDAVVYVELMFTLAFWVPFGIEYARRASWYKSVRKAADELTKKKYLLGTMLDEEPFLEAHWFMEVLEETTRSMNEDVAAHERSLKEYREYLELWVHEIKTPIAAAQLVVQNHPSKESRMISRELARIEQYVMQALYYARTSAVEKDYLIESVSLNDLVGKALKRNASALIPASFSIEKERLDREVFTDPKWMGFVLDQIIQNSIKYRKDDGGLLRFVATDVDGACEFVIEDAGIGVSEQDLPRLFEKGYTGTTGRAYARSTGMGLYICRVLLEKMGLAMRAEHASTGGLRLVIRFPKTSMYNFDDS